MKGDKLLNWYRTETEDFEETEELQSYIKHVLEL